MREFCWSSLYAAGRLLSALYPEQINEYAIKEALDRLRVEAVESINEDGAYGRHALDRLCDYIAGHPEEFEAGAADNAREIVGRRDGDSVWIRAAWLTDRLEQTWGYAAKSVYKEWLPRDGPRASVRSTTARRRSPGP